MEIILLVRQDHFSQKDNCVLLLHQYVECPLLVPDAITSSINELAYYDSVDVRIAYRYEY
jgi:hypothetical protein